MKLSIIYGTRPEFLKLQILIEQLKTSSCCVIKVNQHADYHEDQGYYDHCIQVPKTCETNRLNDIGSVILWQLPKYIEHSNYILVQGDTATCYFASLCAYNMNIKITHLEAGMRTYNVHAPYPEEGYRQMISRMATIHLCPSANEYYNLIQEKIDSCDIHIVGNTILDLVKQYQYTVQDTNCIIVTLHRRENWNKYSEILQQVQYVFYSHNF